MHRHLTVLLAGLLTACASEPVYKTNYEYRPPDSERGRQCLNGCNRQKQSCSSDCHASFQVCQADAASKARENMPILQRQYDIDLHAYLREQDVQRRELNAYNAQKDALESKREYAEALCRQNPSNTLACTQASNAKRSINHLSHPGYASDIRRPTAPSLEKETQRIVQRQCDRECGCQAKYSQCFTACGGVIKETQVCVENCEKL